MEKRETIGKIATDLQKNAQDNTHSADEQMREQLSEYVSNMEQCIARALTKYSTDFYIVVLTKKERLFGNVLRSYFIDRHTCPTPEYDQSVYRYDRSIDDVDLVWVIPSKDTVEFLLDHMLEVPSQERSLLNFVIDFSDGTLLTLAKTLNGEIEGN